MSSKKDHIAIIGAGFSGMALAYLLSKDGYAVTVYDPLEIGDNASGVSAGLLHGFTGPKAKPPLHVQEKLADSLHLFEVAGHALGSSVYQKSGLFRPALSTEQEKHYRKRSEEFTAVHWLEAHKASEKFPGLKPLPGIWIEEGYRVETTKYLKGLWAAAAANGAEWKATEISDPSELKEAIVIAATGASPLLRNIGLTIHPIKGQVLEIRWSIPFPLSGNVYFVPGTSPDSCIVGGTFEHKFCNSSPDISAAKELLFPKIQALFPHFSDCEVIGCRAALRGSTPNRLPICGHHSGKLWVLAGMGSKGLLHHAYFAKQLVGRIQ